MRIHFIAIGGVIMHSLAIELKQQGHIVTGSDDEIYEPSRTNLLRFDLLPNAFGWDPQNINSEIDLVILGMHAKKNNPELIEAQNYRLPILSFPEYIANYSNHDKRIVIAGSHGKTTITSMIIHVLNDNNIEVDYLLGAKIRSCDNLVSLKNNNIIIIEGDEYFSSAIDTRPKFMHYHPDVLVVSGVAWDHINVFPSLKSYEKAFKDILNQVIDRSGQVFYCGDDKFLSNYLVPAKKIKPYFLPKYNINNHVYTINHNESSIKLSVFGQHNLYNLQAAKHVCLDLGLSSNEFYNSIQKFQGAEKRLSLIRQGESSSVYFDFAHSPSKVSATISAVKELYPQRHLISCLELHTFSSLNKNFIPQYINAFQDADEVWIYIDETSHKSQQKVSREFILDSIIHSSLDVITIPSNLENKLRKIELNELNLLIMSSGNFSGLDIEGIFNVSNL
ncbi:Mur ligase family protein [Flavobacteriales bacterium]|nr:Mur ligase family protein [Flavobacteriales bacterium]